MGDSGCGKSTVGNVLMQLTEATKGKIVYDGTDLVTAGKGRRHELRSQMQMVFQDPYSSLNPRQTVRSILKSPLQIHKMAKGEELEKRVEEMADMVGLEPYVLEKFPHELDGGKRQMVGIARALALNPRFIVCDEPVSALDVSVQAQILNILKEIQKKEEIAYLLISHDREVVSWFTDDSKVLKGGILYDLSGTEGEPGRL